MAVSECVPWEADSEVNFNRQDIYYECPWYQNLWKEGERSRIEQREKLNWDANQ